MGMKSWKRNVFRFSPVPVKRLLANMEAVRRLGIRRGGEYENHYAAMDIKRLLMEDRSEEKLRRLNQLIGEARANIPYYKGVLPDVDLKCLQEIAGIPLLRKDELRKDLDRYANRTPTIGHWHGTTGGTSGRLAFLRDLRSIHYEYALYERLYEFAGEASPVKKARFSNVPVSKTGVRKPPYTMEVACMKQLQCSAYHLDKNTYADYIREIAEYGADIGTGYTFLWTRLAEEALAHQDRRLRLKGLVPDGEGMTDEERRMVERAFDCRVYQTYGTSELGMIAVQCECGHYHILDRVHVEIVDEKGLPAPEGVDGEIVVTDLWSTDAPFIRYCPGDRGILRSGGCACGWKTPYLESLTGRVRDYIVTAHGFKVMHVARIMSGIPGIRAFQYVQDEPGQLHIRVETREGFDRAKMEKVHANSRKMVGEMRITWEVVDRIEKSPSGKIKTMVRNFD